MEKAFFFFLLRTLKHPHESGLNVNKTLKDREYFSQILFSLDFSKFAFCCVSNIILNRKGFYF